MCFYNFGRIFAIQGYENTPNNMLHQAKIISWPFVFTLLHNKQTISQVNTYDGNIGFDVAFSIAKY